MSQWVTEGIVVALLVLTGGLAKGWFDLRGMIRKSQQEEMAINTTARLELERLLIARVDQLQKHVRENEEELDAAREELHGVREEVATLRAENATLRIRVRDLETENATLRAELKRICAERGGDALRGVTG
jgi:septal ring factor EnvC (AmiA/AmiB activator)